MLKRARQISVTATSGIAIIGVLMMLIGAGAVVLDVVARWLVAGGVYALNEIVTMSFAVAVAACIPAGVARGVGISIDILERVFSPWMQSWLRAFGEFLVLVFLCILSVQIGKYAQEFGAQNRTTVILGLPQAPFIWTVSVLLGISAAVQVLVTLERIIEAAQIQVSRPAVSDVVALLIIVGSVAAIVAFWFQLPDVMRWARQNPSGTIVVAFALLWIFLLLMIPLAAVLGLIGLGGAILYIGVAPAGSTMAANTVEFLTNYEVATLPMFLMMGSFAAAAGIADDVFRLAQVCLGRFRGGLAMATIGGCAGFGAVTGSSLATVATFGRIALPQMESRNYSPSFAAGCVAAGGTLGALIPPSTPLIIFALLTEASIGKLFVAAIVPGIIAVAFYIATTAIVVRLNPALAPAGAKSSKGALLSTLRRCGAAIVLFGSVIGGMYGGIFTATEAAAVGAFGAFVLALIRGTLTKGRLLAVIGETVTSTALIYTLVFAVLIFSYFVAASALPEQMIEIVRSLQLSPSLVIALIILVLFLLGAIMDSFTVLIITIPILTPLVLNMGYDILWWGIVNLIVVEVGLITPPFGLHLFLLKTMLEKTSLMQLYGGVVPFCVADTIRLALMIFLPALTIWLPSQMMN